MKWIVYLSLILVFSQFIMVSGTASDGYSVIIGNVESLEEKIINHANPGDFQFISDHKLDQMPGEVEIIRGYFRPQNEKEYDERGSLPILVFYTPYIGSNIEKEEGRRSEYVGNFYISVSTSQVNGYSEYVNPIFDAIVTVLHDSSAEPAQTNPYHSILISYLKDPMYAAPSGFGKLSDSSILKALQQDSTGSAKTLTDSMLAEIAWAEYLSGIPVPPMNYGYDQNLFSEKKSLTEFMKEQGQDEAISAISDKLLDLLENSVVEQPTSIIPMGSLTNLYSTGMSLAEFYRDNMLVTEFQDDIRKSYFSHRDNGKNPSDALAAARYDNTDVYSGYLEGLIRKGNSESSLQAALEHQYAYYNWRETVKAYTGSNKYVKITGITMKPKYWDSMETILLAAQEIEKNS